MAAFSCTASPGHRFRRLVALFTVVLTFATAFDISPAAAQDDAPDEEQFTEAHTTPSVNVEPVPLQPYAAPDEPHVVITGGGWGHGVGMSQYGAYGRAEAGQNYRQILQAYYTGVDITVTDLAGDIEVHLIKASALTFRPEGPIALKGGQTTIAEAENGDTVRISRADGAYEIRVNDKSVCGGDQQSVCPKNQMGVQARGNGRVPVGVDETGNRYQYGRFRLRTATDGKIDLSVASMTVEQYLYGLGEMPASWPLDALQAQALAGRTFAIRLIQSRRGNWSHPWDLWSTVLDQAYTGMRYETGPSGHRWVQAVNNTTDQVITHNGSLISANYSSSNGGSSASNSYVWGSSQLPYLVSIDDAYDDHKNPYGKWQRTYTLRDLSRYFARYTSSDVGDITDISFSGPYGDSGRIDRAQVTLTGTEGSRTISGALFRIRINAGLGLDGKYLLADQVLSTNLSISEIRGLEPTIGNEHKPQGKFRFDEVNTDQSPPSVAIRGWALDLDADEPLLVRVHRNGTQIHAVTANAYRPTIGARFNTGNNHGIDIDVDLVPGMNEICLTALDLTPNAPSTNLGCRSISSTAPSGTMQVAVDYVGAPKLVMTGSAIDTDNAGRTGIHVYIDGTYAGGTATASGSANWSLTRIAFEGGHRVCGYALDNASGGQASPLGCYSVTVTDRIDAPSGIVAPVGLLESVIQNGTALTVNGWAFDPNSSSPVRLAINVDGNRFLNTYADDNRPGLGQRFKRDPRIGFSETLQLSPGRHQVCIWAAKPGPNTLVACLFPNL